MKLKDFVMFSCASWWWHKAGAVAKSTVVLQQQKPWLLLCNNHGDERNLYDMVLSAERNQTVTEAPESRSDTVGFSVQGASQSRTQGAGGSGDSRLCSHCGRKGHEKEKCFELIGWPEWVGTAGRGGRSGGRSSSRGGRAGGHGGGRGRGGFAAAVDSSRQVGVSNSEVDHNTLPTLTDAQPREVSMENQGVRVNNGEDMQVGATVEISSTSPPTPIDGASASNRSQASSIGDGGGGSSSVMIGSGSEWILIVGLDRAIHLYNPLTRVLLPLPSYHTFLHQPGEDEDGSVANEELYDDNEWFRNLYIRRAFVVPPRHPHEKDKLLV
ncbi:RNA-binding protein lark, partial [Bienertia sinuspersici]